MQTLEPPERLERTPISVYLTRSLCQLLDDRAAAEQVSRNALIRRFIDAGLATDAVEQ